MDTPDPTTNRKYDGDEPDELDEHWHEPGDPDGVVAAETERMWHADKPAYTHPGPAPYEPKKHWPAVLLVLLLVASAVVGAYFLGFRKASVPIAKKEQVAHNKSERKFAPATTVTKHYDSTTYTLSIDYPDNWMVADTAAKLTIASPSFAMVTQDGTTDGHVIVTIQNQQSAIPGYPSGGATANIQSDKLTYKQPSGIQRGQTYLSYLGYTTTNGLDALYLTGDSGYQVGQNVPMSDIAKGNPLIGVTFAKCAKSYCSSGAVTPMTIAASSWDKAAFKAEIINLLQSLVLN